MEMCREEKERPIDHRKRALIAVGRTAPNNKRRREQKCRCLMRFAETDSRAALPLNIDEPKTRQSSTRSGFAFTFAMADNSKREKYFLYNSLSILLKAVEKKRTMIDLRNEATVLGIVEQADAYMNVVMRDCIFTDPRGDSFKYDMFFVQARNIRCVHIPSSIRIIPAIMEQLKRLSHSSREMTGTKYTYKAKRAKQRQQEGLAAVKQILESRNTTKETTKNEDKSVKN